MSTANKWSRLRLIKLFIRKIYFDTTKLGPFRTQVIVLNIVVFASTSSLRPAENTAMSRST